MVGLKLQPPLEIMQTHDRLVALSGFEVIKTDDNLACDADPDHLAITKYLSWFDALSADFGYSQAIQYLQMINPLLEISSPSSGAVA